MKNKNEEKSINFPDIQGKLISNVVSINFKSDAADAAIRVFKNKQLAFYGSTRVGTVEKTATGFSVKSDKIEPGMNYILKEPGKGDKGIICTGIITKVADPKPETTAVAGQATKETKAKE